jgi:type II secretory pathway component PulJ
MNSQQVFQRVAELTQELVKKNSNGVCGKSTYEILMTCKGNVSTLHFTGQNSDNSATVEVSGKLTLKTRADQSQQYTCIMSPWTFKLLKLKDLEIKKNTSFVEFDDDLDKLLKKVVRRVVFMGSDYMHCYMCQRCTEKEYPNTAKAFADHVGFDGKVVPSFFRDEPSAGEGAAAVVGKRSADELLKENDKLKKLLRRQKFDFEEQQSVLVNENKSLKAQLQSANHTAQSAGQILAELARLRSESAKKDQEIAQLRQAQPGYVAVLAENCGMKRRIMEMGGSWP